MKKLLIGVGVLIVVVIAAAIIVPLVIPVTVYEGELVALVRQSTGRTLRIGGPVKLSLLPRLALEANDVALANLPGGQAPQMVQLKQLQVQLQLLPLLHGAIAVDRFVLVDPVIALEVDKTGHPNWVFAPSGGVPPASAATATPAASGGTSLAGVSLENVQLTNGKISYFDARTGKTEQVDGIDMKLSLPDLASPFKAEGSAVWNREKVTLSLDVDKPGALLAGAESPVGMKLAGNPLSLSFSGQVTGLPSAKTAGEVDFETASLRGLAQWLGRPIAMSGSGLGPVSIKGDVAVSGDKYAFNDAAIKLDAISAKGALSVDTGGARPTLSGKLAVDKLDLNPYLPPETSTASAPAPATGSAPATKEAGWSDAPIDVSPLHVADVDFALQAGAILYRKFQIGQSALDIQVKDGHLTADLSQMALYQGTGQGKVTVDGSGAVPAVAMNFDLAKVQIEPLAAAAMGNDRFSGTGSLTIAVTGHGKSQRELIGTLDGKGTLNLANGEIKGVNLLDLAEQAAKTGGGSGGGSTNFGTLSATYTIVDGVVRTNDLQLQSGTVPMTGAGTVSLPARTIDFEMTPKLPGGIAVPIKIAGPWEAPGYHPDLSRLLRGIVNEPGKLLNTLKSGGGAAGGGAGTLLKSLLGK